jgi:hypothetical protein
MTDPTPDLSKLLPTRLLNGTHVARREHISRTDGDRWTVTVERVELTRGWRYEVNAEYDASDVDGPVRRRDTLWLPDHDQAQRLARAAADRLRSITFGGPTRPGKTSSPRSRASSICGSRSRDEPPIHRVGSRARPGLRRRARARRRPRSLRRRRVPRANVGRGVRVRRPGARRGLDAARRPPPPRDRCASCSTPRCASCSTPAPTCPRGSNTTLTARCPATRPRPPSCASCCVIAAANRRAAGAGVVGSASRSRAMRGELRALRARVAELEARDQRRRSPRGSTLAAPAGDG